MSTWRIHVEKITVGHSIEILDQKTHVVQNRTIVDHSPLQGKVGFSHKEQRKYAVDQQWEN